MEEPNEEKSRSREFIPDLPVTDEEADHAAAVLKLFLSPAREYASGS